MSYVLINLGFTPLVLVLFFLVLLKDDKLNLAGIVEKKRTSCKKVGEVVAVVVVVVDVVEIPVEINQVLVLLINKQ